MPNALAKAVPLSWTVDGRGLSPAAIKINWTLTYEERLGRENQVPEHLAGVPSALPEDRHDDIDYAQRGILVWVALFDGNCSVVF